MGFLVKSVKFRLDERQSRNCLEVSRLESWSILKGVEALLNDYADIVKKSEWKEMMKHFML
jgi:hypothetical protein